MAERYLRIILRTSVFGTVLYIFSISTQLNHGLKQGSAFLILNFDKDSYRKAKRIRKMGNA
jgi:hypothetical protein